MDDTLYKDLFLFELERKESLAERGGVLVGGLTVIGGLMGFMVDGHDFDESSTAFSTFLGIGVACYAISLVYFVLFFRGYTYRALPTPKALQQCHRELVKYYDEYPTAVGTAESTFRDYLNGLYAETTEVNARNNQSKAACQARAVSWLIYAAIACFAAAIPHFVARKSASPKVVRVTVVSGSEESK